MNEKSQIWTILLVAVIVAIAASLITLSITGNTINVAKGTSGKVYTAAEVDSKITAVENQMCAKYLVLTEGVVKEFRLSGNLYKAKINFISSSQAIIEVNGINTAKLSAGQTEKLATATLTIKELSFPTSIDGVSTLTMVVNAC